MLYATRGAHDRDPAEARTYSVRADGDRPLSFNFNVREFAERGTDRVLIHPALVVALQALRSRFGVVRVLSGFRTPGHNAAVGGDPDSLHLFGMAADVEVPAGGGAGVASFARDVVGLNVGLHASGKMHVSVGTEGGADRTIIEPGVYVPFANMYPGGVDRPTSFAEVATDRPLYSGMAQLSQAGGGLVGSLALVAVGVAVMRETGALPRNLRF